MAYDTTTVPVERSQADIRRLLVNYGAGRFEFGEAEHDGTRWAAIGFAAQGRSVRIRVPHKPIDRAALQRKYTRARSKSLDDLRAEMDEQEAKRIWRVLAWNLKARMEAVAEGFETFEEAFLAHLLDESTGETIYESLVRTGQVELSEPFEGKLLGTGT